MPRTPNPFAKTVKPEQAYAVYTDSRLPGWTWYVLKLYKGLEAGKQDRYARAFCKVVSPMTGPSGDLGDTYLTDLGDTVVSGIDIPTFGRLPRKQAPEVR